MTKTLLVFTIRCEMKSKIAHIDLMRKIGDKIKEIEEIDTFEIQSEPYFKAILQSGRA